MTDTTINGLSVENTAPTSNDLLMLWNAAAGRAEKIKRSNLLSGYGALAVANTWTAAQTMQAGINVGVAGALLSLFADGVIRQALDMAVLNNDATLAISSRARGLVYVDAAAIGLCALYSVDSAGSTLVAGSATYFGTAAGTAGKFNVYNNAGQLTLQNKYGSVSTVLVLVIG